MHPSNDVVESAGSAPAFAGALVNFVAPGCCTAAECVFWVQARNCRGRGMPEYRARRRQGDDEHSLTGSIYSTIEAPEAWGEVVPRIARWLGAESALLFTPGEGHTPRGFGVLHNIPREAIGQYGAYYHTCDVWWEAGSRNGVLKAGKHFRGEQVLPTKEMTRSEIYADLWRPIDIGHLMCATLIDEQHAALGPTTCFSFFRGFRKGAFSGEQAARCGSLLPHMRRALLTNWRLQGAQRLLEAYRTGLRATGDVVLLLGADMCVHHASAQPPEMFGPLAPLQIAHGKLTAAGCEQQKRLHRAVRDAAGGGPFGALRLEGQAGSELEVAILPFAAGGLVAHVRRIQRSAREVVARVAERFSLTEAEQRILVLLAGGLGIAAISAELSIRPMTVRTHLANLFEKTGTHSQRELVALVWRKA